MSRLKKKITCGKCNNLATWYYMPAYSWKRKKDSYYCEEHVPRGCSCNQYYVEKWDITNTEIHWFELTEEELKNYELRDYKDEKGRLLPCCEYIEDEEWFDN